MESADQVHQQVSYKESSIAKTSQGGVDPRTIFNVRMGGPDSPSRAEESPMRESLHMMAP
jgi:hypothetical protein